MFQDRKQVETAQSRQHLSLSLSLSLSHSLVGAMGNEAFYGVSACLGVFHPCLRWAAKLKWRIIQFKTQIASPRMLIPKPNERQ